MREENTRNILPHLEMRKNFLNQIIFNTAKDIINKAKRYMKDQGLYLYWI